MTLEKGTRLGPYDIQSAIGAGGMGEVYRARDTRLNRDVALKILPSEFALDPDRLARFKREAQVLASLNHPNIAQIHSFDDANGVHALVMELVDGPTLTDRIARGAIPLDEALPIAKQIADALEAAHDLGIVHRDLKPANIKIRADGTVKVLDFGLAKAAHGAGSTSFDLANSPTLTSPAMMTGTGTILGTAAYMSPEQARGKPVDKRTDIWAFGCVLYEMLTARLAFSGETVSDAVAAILSREPDWLALPAETPESVRRLLRRSLEKDPRRRVHHIADARIELEERLAQPSASGHLMSTDLSAPIVTNRARVRLAWISVTLSVAAIIAALVLGRIDLFDRSAVDVRVYRSSIILPEGTQIPEERSSANLAPAGRFADGQRVAVSVLDPAAGTRDLWLYDVKRELRTRFTFDAANEFEPIWSPDGDRLAFARGKASVDLYQKPSRGDHEDALLEGGLSKFPSDWSPNGRFILYVAGGAAIARSDLLVLPLFGDKKPFPFLETPFIETRGRFSPDGRWIAYASDESGQLEIYVARFPEPVERRRVSTAGGVWPRWRRDGREIVYLAPDNTLTAATVNGEAAGFEAGAARPLFAVRPRPQVTLGAYPYDVFADGQRFLVNTLVEETTSSAITLVVNWTAGLKK